MWKGKTKNSRVKYIKVAIAATLFGFAGGAYALDEVLASGEDVEIQDVKMSEGINTKVFSDVKADFWASDSIIWASSVGIIKGYDTGLFKPNSLLTEAQFSVMLTRYYSDLGNEASKYTNLDNAVWSNSTYEALARYKVPLLGYNDSTSRNAPITRGVMALAISHVQGESSTLDGAVQFLFDSGITTGQNPKALNQLDKYGYKNNLTRAQAAVFFHRLEERGKQDLASSVESGKLTVTDSTSAKKNATDLVDNRLKPVVTPKPPTSGGDRVLPGVVNPPVTKPGDKLPSSLPEPAGYDKVISKENKNIIGTIEGVIGKSHEYKTIENKIIVRKGTKQVLSYNKVDKNYFYVEDRNYTNNSFEIMRKLGMTLTKKEYEGLITKSGNSLRQENLKGVSVYAVGHSMTITW